MDDRIAELPPAPYWLAFLAAEAKTYDVGEHRRLLYYRRDHKMAWRLIPAEWLGCAE